MAVEYGFDRMKFLEHTCNKAGLPVTAIRVATVRYISSQQLYLEKRIKRVKILYPGPLIISAI